jgi:hypothetical protein
MKIVFLFLEEDFARILKDRACLESIRDAYPEADYVILVYRRRYAVLMLSDDTEDENDGGSAYLACRDEIISRMGIGALTRIHPN